MQSLESQQVVLLEKEKTRLMILDSWFMIHTHHLIEDMSPEDQLGVE